MGRRQKLRTERKDGALLACLRSTSAYLQRSLGMAVPLLRRQAIIRARRWSCPDRWGEPGEPLVASERTARDIFIAIEREFFPGADKKNFPDVKARDEGAYWGVFRHRDSRRDRPKDGEIILHFAGHQLEMQIDKCTAAVSNVHYSR